ncbi:MAG TPA: [FeFe] hydrogenase H-cluster radical SAM maturase HydE [Candidatus Hydrogenedentes bacterium]|nr:[FeFe] hydrogenase H-cluster radical SAM maturase HydE [Candidatus Hydrogenedentota bacterium]HOV75071.1 [FeFe] hydrogenase H-cluster radical SAM maturase HydE [Candidatus Hydrogenedentota bacterium]
MGEFSNLDTAAILGWLREEDPERLETLWKAADAVRKANVGDEVHLRGLIEISNYCCRLCGYCGLRADNKGLDRYRMSEDEIMACVHQAAEYGYGTVVMQAGEDYGITREWLANLIRRIKSETALAVTLSLGERPDADLAAWREAGADRYLLRFETSDADLYALIHPAHAGRLSDRIAMLRRLREIGYEPGSGVMVGIPGQTYANLARDLETFRALDLDMIGVGPYLSHPSTPLGQGRWTRKVAPEDQAPNTELMTYKTVALTRLLCPHSNIPSTTALATINKARGRELGLMRGANVVMPNLTPVKYRALYEIYPAKACIDETAQQCRACLHARIASIGRSVGKGPGGRRKNATIGE